MSTMIENTKKRIAEYERKLIDPEISEWSKESLTRSLNSYKRSLTFLENPDFVEAVSEMGTIMRHTRAVDEKYNCTSIKIMFSVADFFDKFKFAPTIWMANKIRNYAVDKIDAPVCSIVNNSKEELPPMPTHSSNDTLASGVSEKDAKEMGKYLDITKEFMDPKPSVTEKIKIFISK